jgi:hypothetical protein
MKNKKYHIVTKANINIGTPVMNIHDQCIPCIGRGTYRNKDIILKLNTMCAVAKYKS